MVAFAVLRASIALVGLFASSAVAAPAATQVLTPKGYRPSANVHEVPAGGKVTHVGDEVHLVDAQGKVLHVAKNDAATNVTKPFPTGWTAYADWYNSGAAINNFLTTWSVPPTPATNSGQTVFLFNSIEPASYNAILQPVLQWGGSAAGGGAYWAVANWYVTGSNSYFSTLATVSVGQSLTGQIQLLSSSGSAYTYVSKFTNVGQALEVQNIPELVWATETLECYGITTASNYPAGSTVFSNIDITTTSGTPSVSWSTTSDTADGVTATVNIGGATGAEVTIKY